MQMLRTFPQILHWIFFCLIKKLLLYLHWEIWASHPRRLLSLAAMINIHETACDDETCIIKRSMARASLRNVHSNYGKNVIFLAQKSLVKVFELERVGEKAQHLLVTYLSIPSAVVKVFPLKCDYNQAMEE